MTARWVTADVYDGLATLDDGSVDVVITSPPFLALRSYLPSDHPDKSKEIGSEATPAEFIDTMLRVTAELRRVLAPHGSICVELGDTYASDQGRGPDWTMGGERFTNEGPRRSFTGPEDRRMATVSKFGAGWPLAKSRALIPQLYEIALAYGANPLTGQPSPAGQWRIRNVVTWARPNPPVGALGDKWRPATSDVVVACTSDKRYWDDLATRRPASPNTHARSATPRHDLPSQQRDGNWSTLAQIDSDPAAGGPLLDYWEIPPGGYKGSHYAVFPSALVEPLVKAMCPPKVCRECGEPSRRIVSEATYLNTLDEKPARLKSEVWRHGDGPHGPLVNQSGATGYRQTATRQVDTLGWTDCGHKCISCDGTGKVYGEWQRDFDGGVSGHQGRHRKIMCQECGGTGRPYRPGIVLDPFAGSGTTLSVATGHGHDAIGIDLDPRNADLARDRIGPFFFEEVTA